jgi:hypothetical protein
MSDDDGQTWRRRARDTNEEIEVEVLPPGSPERKGSQQDREALAKLIALIMDTMFRVPGTNVRFGLDPIVGLVPGLGNAVSAIVSSFVLLQSVRSGIPRIVLVRMALNVLINTTAGAVPIVGDLFSVWWKSNVRNYRLYQKHASDTATSTSNDWFFVIILISLILLGLLAVLALLVWVAVRVMQLLLGG